MTLQPLPAPTPLATTDLDAYAALGTRAVCIPADVCWITMAGEKAVDALNGLITNDVATLGDGDVVRAAALTPKGKLLADLLVWRRGPTALTLVMDPSSTEAFSSMARKYVNPRLATVRDETAEGRAWWLLGAGVPSMGGDHGWPPGASVASCPSLGAYQRVLVRATTADAPEVMAWLAAHALPGSAALLEVLRVEAGDPAFGVDMDDGTIPQEANLDALGAISFTKGCYTGQETVARVHFRGHVNRHLRGLRSAEPLAGGRVVTDAEGKEIGDVRSTVVSPRFGAIALAMIRREVAPGSVVQIRHEGETEGEQRIEAHVEALPFAAGTAG